MSEPNLHPDEIFQRREELGVKNSVKMLTEILNSAKENQKRVRAIKYLGLVSEETPQISIECYDILENILISDEGIEIKCEAAKALGKLKLEKALKPLKWILDQESIDPAIFLAVLDAINNIRFEAAEIKLFIENLDAKYIDVKKFARNQLLDLMPDVLIKYLLESLKIDNYSNEHKSEIFKLIGYELSSINISFEDVSYLKTKYPQVITNLIKHKNILLDEITRVLKEEDTDFMNSIISILKLLGDEIKDDLIKLLLTDDFIVKKNAIIISGRLRIKESLDSLYNNLDSLYSEVTIASIEALGQIGDISAVPQLLDILNIDDVSFEYTDIDMKFQIIDAIKMIYTQNEGVSYDYLFTYLDKDNDTIKESIAFILGEIGREEFNEPLIAILKVRNLDIRKNACIALGKIGSVSSLNTLISLLNSNSTYWLLKKVAADAVYNIFQKNWYKLKRTENELWRNLNRDFARLIEYLKSGEDEDFKVKLSIIKILGTFGDKKAIDALLSRVNDFHRTVRIHASNAIKRIEERLELEEEMQ
ncbi:MAG: HEAT repeat domain-containing protein [Candidatus Lokiarchaeota archaeon]|nr:HEAT repeat domain-containing protein [Candidatus Lokiarchaeota archaeon]